MRALDLVIRGGVIVDGSGGAPFGGDVGVADGRIVAIGDVPERGAREIDADGALVAPGWVDLHTHYDGQVTWDDHVLPSAWHGVTTVVMGNCGVGFAPAVDDDHDRLVELMEGVEDIPGVALQEGLSWEWESFPDYLDFLDRRHYDIDIAAQLPHAPLRVYAMGAERAVAREIATDEEIRRMVAITEDAMRAGAIGFSTSRTLNHKSVRGEVIPSYAAATSELVAIAGAMGDVGSGVLQLVSDFDDREAELELIQHILERSGRPMSISVTQNPQRPDLYRELLDALANLSRRGHQVKAQVATRGIGMILGLDCTLHPFSTNRVWQRLAHLPAREQAAAMTDPAIRSEILAAQTSELDPNTPRGLRFDSWDVMFALSDPPDYEPDPSTSIAAQARRAGLTPDEIAYDILLADLGRGMIYLPFRNYVDGSLSGVLTMLTHDLTLPGLSDGGAHVGMICDASFPTSLLQHWVRDRPNGRLELAFAVKRQARDTARAVGLVDRGEITPGLRADITVIDMDGLRLHRPEIRHDLPAGGRRLVQRVEGYCHIFVNGVETYSHGEATGALPGGLVRRAVPR